MNTFTVSPAWEFGRRSSSFAGQEAGASKTGFPSSSLGTSKPAIRNIDLAPLPLGDDLQPDNYLKLFVLFVPFVEKIILPKLMKLKLRLYYKLFQIIILFIKGLIIAGLVFPALGFLYSTRIAKTKRDALKTRWLGWFSTIVNLHIITDGELPERRAIFVSNHISWLDIIVIGQYLPAYFVAKSDISSWPVIGYLARQGGTIFIRRGNKQQIRTTAEKMVWLLKQNSNIIAFPEGTTTIGNEVLHFHPSLFQPALLTRSAIQPVTLQYQGPAKELAPFVGDDAFVPHLIKMLTLDKIEVQLSFLPVINSSGKNRQSVSLEARNMIWDKISEYSPTDIPIAHQNSAPLLPLPLERIGVRRF
jgi:1-acyl-sn-glycerol-3-phosphate acyltransferase